MKDRNKRNLIIGILCCLLVFMGVGFAVMNATLNINGTASAINTWDVRMTKIEVTEKSDGASNNEELTKINDDGVTATFRSDFTKPGDYIIYEVTVENRGSIDAVLNDISITLNGSETDKDLFNITDTRPNNQLLEAGTSTTFTIKVEFRSDADRMPSGDIEYTVKVDYSQQTGEMDGEEEYEDWLYKIDESGTITAYNYDSKLVEDTSIAVVPATIDGIQVKNIDEKSFLKFNAAMFQNTDGTGGFVIYDGINYDIIVNKIEEFLDTMGNDASAFKNYYYVGQSSIPSDIQLEKVYIDVTKSGTEILGTMNKQIKKIDLSNAIYLESIKEFSFESSCDTNEVRLEEIKFSENGNLKYIEEKAFWESDLKNVYIPSSVVAIGSDAFGHNSSPCSSKSIETLSFAEGSNLISIGERSFVFNKITRLTLPEKVEEIKLSAFYANDIQGNLLLPSSLKTIGPSAFTANEITSVEIPVTVTAIGRYAFYSEKDSEGNSTLSSIIIKRTEEDFLANVTVETPWYDTTLISKPTYNPS